MARSKPQLPPGAQDLTAEVPGAPDLQLADALTVRGRKRVSAFASAFSAVVSRWGLDAAARELNSIRAKAKDKIDPNEVRRVYLVLVEAAQRVEWRAEQSADPVYSARRRFRVPAALLEMFYRREQLPRDLRAEDRRADREKFLDSRARAWRRRWAKLDAAQCYLHLALFEREQGEARGSAKVSPAFTDHLSDLVAQTARRAAELRGEPVGRYNRAADEVLAAFRASVPRYAPGWEMPAPAEAAEPQPQREADPLKTLRARVAGVVSEAREMLAELRAAGMTEDAEQAARQELIDLFATGLSELSAPPPGGKVAPGVTPNADTIPPDAAARVSARTNLSAFHTHEPLDLAGNSQITPDEREGNSAPPASTSVSLADAEAACTLAASVGVSRVVVTCLDDTKKTGDPGYCTFAEGVTLAEFQQRLPGYLKRNAERGESLSVRLRTREETHVLQVDDCTPEQLAALAPFAFWQVATSPGNAQAWLAFADALTPDSYANVRTRLLKTLNPAGDKSQANGGAGGAIRWPGSMNQKPSRRLADGTSPRVQIIEAAAGRRVTVAELEAAGLLAAPEPAPAPARVLHFTSAKLPAGWPSFDEYLSRRSKGDGTPDRSSGEIAWCCAALRMGWPSYMVESELARLTLKGRGRRDSYVADTVRNAADFLATHPDVRAEQGRERMVI